MSEGTLRVLSVVGTRPNFMKVAPVARRLAADQRFDHILVHTGQHYDETMSRVFFDELGMPEPDVYLGIGSGSHSAQTAKVLERIEPVLAKAAPDVVLVPGDVNSTLAAALAAKQLGLRVGHIEAGLRSFDRTMPEELNRILTDQLSDLLFTHSPEAVQNLLDEGRPAETIHAVGNTMIDTLVSLRSAIADRHAAARYDLTPARYILVTLHRPALVDGPLLAATMASLAELSQHFEVIFPVHPRTRQRLEAAAGTGARSPQLRLIEPLGYLDFMSLVENAAAVLTDSGGVQEETSFLGVSCFTLRANTERPITLELGTNTLLGLDPTRIADIPDLIFAGAEQCRRTLSGWDGNAAARVVSVLGELIEP